MSVDVARRWGWRPCSHAACNEHGPAALLLRGRVACYRCASRVGLRVEYVTPGQDGGLLCARNARVVCERCESA